MQLCDRDSGLRSRVSKPGVQRDTFELQSRVRPARPNRQSHPAEAWPGAPCACVRIPRCPALHAEVLRQFRAADVKFQPASSESAAQHTQSPARPGLRAQPGSPATRLQCAYARAPQNASPLTLQNESLMACTWSLVFVSGERPKCFSRQSDSCRMICEHISAYVANVFRNVPPTLGFACAEVDASMLCRIDWISFATP